MDIRNYTEANREAWNQVTPIHQQQRKQNLEEAVQSPTFSVLSEIEEDIFRRIPIHGKKIAQFCCNNGRELISAVKMGAASGVGFDIADEAIKEAAILAELANTKCTFVRTNIYDIDKTYAYHFDVVYITIGSLTWFDDLEELFRIVSLVLKSGGHLFIYEMHPFLDMMATKDDNEYSQEDELRIAFPYFRKEPWVDENGLDYIGETTYDAKTTYSFSHTLSSIFNSILSNGLSVLEFQEYPKDISAVFQHLESYQKIPMSYIALARKK